MAWFLANLGGQPVVAHGLLTAPPRPASLTDRGAVAVAGAGGGQRAGAGGQAERAGEQHAHGHEQEGVGDGPRLFRAGGAVLIGVATFGYSAASGRDLIIEVAAFAIAVLVVAYWLLADLRPGHPQLRVLAVP